MLEITKGNILGNKERTGDCKFTTQVWENDKWSAQGETECIAWNMLFLFCLDITSFLIRLTNSSCTGNGVGFCLFCTIPQAVTYAVAFFKIQSTIVPSPFCSPPHKVRKGKYWISHRLSIRLSVRSQQITQITLSEFNVMASRETVSTMGKPAYKKKKKKKKKSILFS